MRRGSLLLLGFVILALFLLTTPAVAEQPSPTRILIHMKTSLAEDDAQICAMPNVAWASVKAGHEVTILVDASAVTSVTKGFGWFNGMFRSDSTALDRAALPERERQSLSEQRRGPSGTGATQLWRVFELPQGDGRGDLWESNNDVAL